MESLNDSNIHDAVNLWCNYKEGAILKYGHISNWDVSNVTNMNGLFCLKIFFNDCINNWNVSNVKNMDDMFNSASSFNQNLNNWNVSNVTNMVRIFFNATSFNQNLNNWNVSNVTEPSSRLAKARRDKSRYLYINIFNDV